MGAFRSRSGRFGREIPTCSLQGGTAERTERCDESLRDPIQVAKDDNGKKLRMKHLGLKPGLLMVVERVVGGCWCLLCLGELFRAFGSLSQCLLAINGAMLQQLNTIDIS